MFMFKTQSYIILITLTWQRAVKILYTLLQCIMFTLYANKILKQTYLSLFKLQYYGDKMHLSALAR
jgi:hypothetical protein